MKYAICNELFQGQPWSKVVALMRQLGYTGIEIAPFTLQPNEPWLDVTTVDAVDRQPFRQLAEEAGLEVVGLHWLLARTRGLHLTSPDEQVRQRTADYLIAQARLCCELGGQVMVLGSARQRDLLPGISPARATDYAAETLERVMPSCESLGVMLALEPLSADDTDFLTTASETIELIQRINSSHCRLQLDVKAMSSERVPIPEIIHESRDWLVHFHANDPNGLGPGMGGAEFGPIIKALQAIDYDGWISVETFERGPSPERIARESIGYLKRTLASP